MKEIIIKKPQQQRSWEKFNAILETCPQVLREFGFKKSTAAKMALEADVGIGTFYDYFSCKEAAFVAYLDRELNKALQQVAIQVKDHDMTVQQILRELIGIGVDFAREQKEIIKLIFAHFPAELHLISLEESWALLEKIAMDFASNQNIQLARKDTDLMIYTLTNLVLGFQFRIVVMNDERFKRDDLVDELAGIVTHYLFAESVSPDTTS